MQKDLASKRATSPIEEEEEPGLLQKISGLVLEETAELAVEVVDRNVVDADGVEQLHERTVNELLVRHRPQGGQWTATPNQAARSELSQGSEVCCCSRSYESLYGPS